MFDVVLPIYNSLQHARPCLESVIKYIPDDSKLIVVDDESDEYVSMELKGICDNSNKNIEYIRNEKNLGYLKSCNKGIASGQNPYVVLVNSDVIIFSDTFKILAETFEHDQKIGVINPVSTWANWTRIPFPNGFNINEVNDFVTNFQDPDQNISDIGNASGFLLAIKRELFNKYGYFDEVFEPGYYEEADFCMRVLDEGYRVVVNKGLYVFHQGWGSFGEESRNLLMERNEKEFFRRWGTKYTELRQNWLKNDPLHELKIALENAVPVKEKSLLKVVYFLPEVNLYGGVISVIQIVNQLNLLGVNANIATYSVNENFLRKYPLYFRPHIFKSEEDLLKNFPECDIAVATHWSTVSPLITIKEDRGTKLVYFVQDFEPDFYEKDSDNYKQSIKTYNLIYTKIVKSLWLKEKLKHFVGEIHQIPIGLNTDIFYDKKDIRDIDIIAHARPSSERRNFPVLKEVFKRLKEEDESIKLGVYGSNYTSNDFEVPVTDFGVLNNAQEVADALNRSVIALDISTFQGLGRPGLEAMACGTATVLTRNGGITEYAKHKYNTLLVNPFNINEILLKLKILLTDNQMRRKFIEQGFKTSNNYYIRKESELTKDIFESLVD